MAVTGNYSLSVSAGGVSIVESVTVTGNSPIAYDQLLSAGKTVTSWVKTDLDTATCVLPGGHGYTDGTFDVFFAAGVRYNVPGTIATNALTLDGGVGTDFPATTAACIVSRNVQLMQTIYGIGGLKMLSILAKSSDVTSTARAHITLFDGASNPLLALTLAQGKPRFYDVENGMSAVLAGVISTYAMLGVEADLTIKIAGVQDADI